MSDKEIVCFQFSKSALNRLDEMMVSSKCKSRAEVVRNALRIFEYVVRQFDEGKKIVLEDQDHNHHDYDSRESFIEKVLF